MLKAKSGIEKKRDESTGVYPIIYCSWVAKSMQDFLALPNLAKTYTIFHIYVFPLFTYI